MLARYTFSRIFVGANVTWFLAKLKDLSDYHLFVFGLQVVEGKEKRYASVALDVSVFGKFRFTWVLQKLKGWASLLEMVCTL